MLNLFTLKNLHKFEEILYEKTGFYLHLSRLKKTAESERAHRKSELLERCIHSIISIQVLYQMNFHNTFNNQRVTARIKSHSGIFSADRNEFFCYLEKKIKKNKIIRSV